jgi:RimJ/RimL family protein N-acetyltransferase
MLPLTRPERIELSGTVLEFALVPWDSRVFGFPVAQIHSFEVGHGSDPVAVLRDFDSWCARQSVRLVSCRLESTRLRESMALEEIGFRFVEMVYEPNLASFERVAPPSHDVHVGPALTRDRAAIEEIAYSAFTTGRYLLDWRLPPDFSKRRYAAWVRTSFDSEQQLVLKAELQGELVGFFIIERGPNASVYWHLTAVGPRWQGRGVGLSLWRTMLLQHKAEGATRVATTISGHNAAAINLYARLGFSFGSAQMTFHWFRAS